MRKVIILFLAISLLILGCETQVTYDSDERSEIVKWAKQIAKFEKSAESIMEDYNSLTIEISSHYPSNKEIDQLTSYYNLLTHLYNELSKINPPTKALSAHKKFVENYSKASDTVLFYLISLKQNDISYFEKSVTASKEGNRIGDDAYDEFVNLLNYYSISCEEIDFCE